MDIETTRFGTVQIEPEDEIRFPAGLIGLEDCRRWVLLADDHNDALGWLQSTECPEVALAVVSPRRFVQGYQVRLARRDLDPLGLETLGDAQVLVVVSMSNGAIVANLKAPLVFHLERGLGAQVIAKDPHPLQHELAPAPAPLRRSA